MNLLPDERIEELLGNKIDETNLSVEDELQNYSDIIEEKYGEKPERLLSKIPKIDRTLAELQLANEVLQRQEARLQQLEAVNEENRKRAAIAESKLKEVEKFREKLEARKTASKRNKRKQNSKRKKPSKRR